MRRLELLETAYTLPQLKEKLPAGPQVALAGRSNVGKSSLINRLGGSKKLARISSSPGKTRSLNFYRVDPVGYFLADLPGYGYAKASKTDRNAWAKLIETYLETTSNLRGVAVLLDCRLDPQKLDMEMTSYVLNLGLPLLPVLTKADKCKQKERSKRQSQWRDILQAEAPPLLFSSATGMGVETLWNVLDELAQEEFEA
ncbi:ribosome biogenesis GTP-binding protein YihA/YsxC [Desulfohalovibrio reitneri]|uniref:ribosome biogenesis GTP-binding protein YihA/YsxC n=1 Tax=Desulfohalovibrio reitneri TaxID=1307759 RepID=UPI0004A6DF97|nr:ribosome biogenesis GTP-binding protein YihA/YsxC [Desulfohalovibrio reitneri]